MNIVDLAIERSQKKKDYFREYYAKNKVKMNEKFRYKWKTDSEWRKKRLAHINSYYAKNRERILGDDDRKARAREYSRKYYRENKEMIVRKLREKKEAERGIVEAKNKN